MCACVTRRSVDLLFSDQRGKKAYATATNIRDRCECECSCECMSGFGLSCDNHCHLVLTRISYFFLFAIEANMSRDILLLSIIIRSLKFHNELRMKSWYVNSFPALPLPAGSIVFGLQLDRGLLNLPESTNTLTIHIYKSIAEHWRTPTSHTRTLTRLDEKLMEHSFHDVLDTSHQYTCVW